MKKSLQYGLWLAILFLINMVSLWLGWQWDVTEYGSYTLSEGSREVLAQLQEPVELTFYYSQSAAGMPVSFKNYAARVERLLRQYEQAASGEINVTLIDPKPDSDAEETALAAGITGQKLTSGQRIFLGIRVTQGEREAIYPLLQPQREPSLEYDLTRLIYEVQRVERPTIALFSSLDLGGKRSQTSQFYRELQRFFTIKEVEGGHLPEDADLVLVVHPIGIPEVLEYEIDQFALAGKPVILVVDPASLSDQQDNITSSDLPLLFKGWGVKYDRERTLGDLDYGFQMPGHLESQYVVNLDVRKFNRKHPATDRLERVLFPAAGVFDFELPKAAEIIPLVSSSPESSLLMTSLLGQSTPEMLRKQVQPGKRRRVLVALLHGYLDTAFPDGRPLVSEEEGRRWVELLNREDEARLRKSAQPAKVILVGDTDFFADAFSVERTHFLGTEMLMPINDNQALMENIIEWAMGDEHLLTLRSKGDSVRTFTRVETMIRQAQERYHERLKALEWRLQQIQNEVIGLEHPEEEIDAPLPPDKVAQLLESFRKEEIDLRKERRIIRKRLREDVEQLNRQLGMLNLLLIPLVIALWGTLFFARRKRGVPRDK